MTSAHAFTSLSMFPRQLITIVVRALDRLLERLLVQRLHDHEVHSTCQYLLAYQVLHGSLGRRVQVDAADVQAHLLRPQRSA